MQIAQSRGKGRGVFATYQIGKNEVFHVAPVLLINRTTPLGVLDHYVFHWSKEEVALALGYGSLFNHSNQPNAEFEQVLDKTFPAIKFKAKKTINPGNEIYINYGHLYEWENHPR